MQYDRASVSERRTMPPAVAVSTVAFALQPPREAALGVAGGRRGADPDAERPTVWMPLVRRTRAPYRGCWALPGGPTQWDETLTGTALRTLHDAVLRDPGYLEQLYSFGGVERSADAQRLVTIAYWALYGERELSEEPGAPLPPAGEQADTPGRRNADARVRWDDPRPGPGDRTADLAATDRADAENVAWFSADSLPELAFDHAEIISYALSRLRGKTEYTALAHRFLGTEFTLGQLRTVYEALTGKRSDPANFRRQALARGNLIDTGEYETGARHRPSRLYRFHQTPDPSERSMP